MPLFVLHLCVACVEIRCQFKEFKRAKRVVERVVKENRKERIIVISRMEREERDVERGKI